MLNPETEKTAMDFVYHRKPLFRGELWADLEPELEDYLERKRRLQPQRELEMDTMLVP